MQRCTTVTEILDKLGETGLPAELHMEPDDHLPHCAIAHVGTSLERLATVAENALNTASKCGALGVFIVGQPVPG